MSYTEWRRACVELLGDMVDGARSTLSWTDDGDAVAEVLNVVKALKNTLREIDSMVSIDDDIFMSQPGVPVPVQDKGFDVFKSEIKDLFHSLEANLSSRISNVERRLGSVPLPSSMPTSTHSAPNSRPQASTPSSYMSAAKSAPSGQSKPNQQSKSMAPAPASKSNTKSPTPEAERKSSHILFHALNHTFSNNPAARNDGLEILGAEWNRSDHGLDEVIISHDTKWSKAVCLRVPSVGFDGHYWDSKALGVLLRRNPIIKNLKITQEPRFVSNPAEGLPPVAPVVFAFEDPDGSKLKELLKTPIFMDGAIPRCVLGEKSPG
ncbi:Muscle M-line assembly protein [Salix suchowensis]|nr:Muscle M-line assembly protein [Salix suchowensis]